MDGLKKLENIIGYEFDDISLLSTAITHSSFANEMKINKPLDYERLEFLGDAVLELTVSEFLYNQPENYKEGRMTRMRASLVCEVSLASIIKENHIYEYIRLGKGEEATGGRLRDSILCDIFEAIAGAIYYDGGFEAAKTYIKKFLLDDWKNKMLLNDCKTILQEKVQEEKKSISYRVIKEDGPPHDRTFTVELLIDGETVATGEGHSKKNAEQMAAYKYLKENN